LIGGSGARSSALVEDLDSIARGPVDSISRKQAAAVTLGFARIRPGGGQLAGLHVEEENRSPVATSLPLPRPADEFSFTSSAMGSVFQTTAAVGGERVGWRRRRWERRSPGRRAPPQGSGRGRCRPSFLNLDAGNSRPSAQRRSRPRERPPLRGPSGNKRRTIEREQSVPVIAGHRSANPCRHRHEVIRGGPR